MICTTTGLHRFTFLRPYIEYEVIDAQSKEIIDSNRGSDKTENSLSALLSDYQKNSVLDADVTMLFLVQSAMEKTEILTLPVSFPMNRQTPHKF